MAQDPDPVESARRRSGNPAVRAGAADPSPRTAEARAKLERRSAPWLVRLATAPRWGVLVVVLALVIVGLLVPGWVGAAVLLLVAALMGWLLALSWPALAGRDRLVRVAVIVLVLADVVWKTLSHT